MFAAVSQFLFKKLNAVEEYYVLYNSPIKFDFVHHSFNELRTFIELPKAYRNPWN